MAQHNYDDDESPQLPGFIPPLVVMGALVGFVWLAWFAYHSGARSLSEDSLLIIEADSTPIKEKPLDPGGMKFPNQDKTVFETFSNGAKQAKVERVLPAPEEPLEKPSEVETKTWVNQKLQAKEIMSMDNAPKTAFDPASSAATEPEPVAEAHSMGTMKKEVDGNIKTYKQEKAEVADVKVATVAPAKEEAPAVKAEAKPVAKEAAPVKEEKKPAVAAAKPIKEEPKAVVEVVDTTSEVQETEKPVAEKPAAKAAAKPAAKAKPTSSAQLQLGAWRSEAECKKAFAEYSKKYAPLASKTPVIVKAEVGDKGTFYRLRVSGFSDKAASISFCNTLKAKGISCNPV